jgi:hypothetical protein
VTQERDAAPRDSADEALADSFWSVARRLRETSQETLAPWDITPAHLRALRVLKRHGTMRLSELSDYLHIAPRSATEPRCWRPSGPRPAAPRPGASSAG